MVGETILKKFLLEYLLQYDVLSSLVDNSAFQASKLIRVLRYF